MNLEGFTYFPEQMKALVNTPGGGVEQTLLFWGVKTQNRAKVLLSQPYPGRRSRNPPPGPPKKRTGDLLNSVTVGQPTIMEDGLIAVPVTSAAVHRGFNYSRWLLDNNYEFIRPDQIVA